MSGVVPSDGVVSGTRVLMNAGSPVLSQSADGTGPGVGVAV